VDAHSRIKERKGQMENEKNKKRASERENTRGCTRESKCMRESGRGGEREGERKNA